MRCLPFLGACEIVWFPKATAHLVVSSHLFRASSTILSEGERPLSNAEDISFVRCTVEEILGDGIIVRRERGMACGKFIKVKIGAITSVGFTVFAFVLQSSTRVSDLRLNRWHLHEISAVRQVNR